MALMDLGNYGTNYGINYGTQRSKCGAKEALNSGNLPESTCLAFNNSGARLACYLYRSSLYIRNRGGRLAVRLGI
jgi:hypothetical protein